MSDDKKKISLPITGDTSVEPSEKDAEAADQSDDVLAVIEKTVTENPVVLYMKGTPQQPMCGFSARAAAIVSSYGRQFAAVNVLADPEVRQGIKTYGQWPTIPQLYVGGELVGGSDILSKMHESGELSGMIEAAYGEHE